MCECVHLWLQIPNKNTSQLPFDPLASPHLLGLCHMHQVWRSWAVRTRALKFPDVLRSFHPSTLYVFERIYLLFCSGEDLTLTSWLWTQYMKGERHDFRAAGKLKKISRRGVSDSDCKAFILLHLLYSRTSPPLKWLARLLRWELCCGEWWTEIT